MISASEPQRFWQINFSMALKEIMRHQEDARDWSGDDKMVERACHIADEALKQLEKRFPPLTDETI